MCNKPWLLCVEYAPVEYADHPNASPGSSITFHEGEGPAEEAGMKALEAQPNAVRFSVYRVVSEFARVTEIKRVSLKPTLLEGN
jgi:hypothetical protein